MRLLRLIVLAMLLPLSALAQGAEGPAATRPADKLPFIKVDLAARRVAVECSAIACPNALEFLCVTEGTNEHESILRTKAKPSQIHLALLMLGLKAGEPVRFSEPANKWLPPQGMPLQISVEYEKGGKTVSMPAWKFFREMKDKKVMQPRTWIFVGSKVYNTGQYAADITGYVVSIVNFDLSLIDVPMLASSSNEQLEYEINPDTVPAEGTPVRMILEPVGMAAVAKLPATGGQGGNVPATQVTADLAKIDALRERWKTSVASHAQAVQDAAKEHYRVITELRAEQNRLLDEAERIGRVIDELEKQYQDMTVPRPAEQDAGPVGENPRP